MESPTPLSDAITAVIRDARRSIGWTQRELEERSGVSQPTICRIERSGAGSIALATSERLLDALGARVEIVVRLPRVSGRADQRDPAHARCQSYVRSRLEREGWEVAQEVEIGGDRSRGWIDTLAFHSLTGALFVGEIKTVGDDMGGTQRQIGWYQREAWAAARRRGWNPRFQLIALLLLATEANDELVRANRQLLKQAFPVRAHSLSGWLADPVGVPLRPSQALALIDPLSRRVAWLRATRSDGRRSPAPYADYADFMRRLAGRG